jgi:hypothetical protein
VATDSLISLPLDVLGEILTRLELRDAVHTSALSPAWHHRWESLPSLDIHIPDVQPLLWAVDSILLCCSGRIRSFYIHLDDVQLPLRAVNSILLSCSGCVRSFRVHVFFFIFAHYIVVLKIA